MNKRPLAGIGSLALNGRYWVLARVSLESDVGQ
jgi:hypothetical protein